MTHLKWHLIGLWFFLPATMLLGEESYPNAKLLILPTELAQFGDTYVILDARDVATYAELHVENARWVDAAGWAKAFGDGTDRVGWSERIGKLGIDAKTKVVVYDDNLMKDAARIWWILRYWGVEDVRLLNSGWKAWAQAKLPVSSGTPPAPHAKEFQAQPRSERLTSKDELLQSLATHSLQVVDARSHGEHCGTDPLGNRRPGSIPEAKHLEWIKLIDKDTGRFKPAEELKRLFREANIDLTKPTATHCQSGGRASVLAFAMELMGAPRVSNYYQGWREWGNSDDTPIESKK